MTSIVDTLSYADVGKIMRLVETLHDSGLQFVRIEADGVEITVAKGGAAQAGAPVAPTVAGSPPSGVVIASPHVGVFRSAPAKGLEVGSPVDATSILGSIQTLDEMNDVKAGVSGEIVEARVRDGDFVEFGQPLFRIVPAGGSESVRLGIAKD